MLENLQNSTVLVTGGVGFIRSNLCETLLSNNIKTVCLDNFSTSKLENIEPILSRNYQMTIMMPLY